MKRIGIISDTHNKLACEAIDRLEGCDRIIHAGDICTPIILMELATIAPVVAVLGNNDYADFGPAVNPVADITIDGVRFIIAHEPRHLRSALASRFAEEAKPDQTIVAVHGHTHVPKLERRRDGDLFDFLICPGAVNRSREQQGRRTLAFVDIDEGVICDIRITSLDGEVISRLFPDPSTENPS